MLLFLALVVLGSTIDLPGLLFAKVDAIARACLITAIAALGIKTSLKALTAVGGGHLAIVVIETMVLLGLAVAALHYIQLL